MHPEFLPDIFCQRMYLKAQIASADGIEKVETDGEFIAKPCMHRIAEKSPAFKEYEVYGRGFEKNAVEIEKEAVFFRNTIETPGIIFSGGSRSNLSFIHCPPQGPGS